MAKDKTTDKSAKREVIQLESLANLNRPKVFEDLVGQDATVAQLRGMFATNRMPPVFLITGDSGIGKTTVSRILARYLNCTNRHPKTHDPCGECASCSFPGNHPDFLELNIANQRGIDDMRGLIDSARNSPSVGNFRIILLDEVHRMTPAAAPILLKPLEDPPKKTIWILATTNPEQLPPTILGRCHSLKLKPIEIDAMSKRLSRIARKEGVDLKERDDGDKILKTIGNYSRGQMRNAISMLDNVLFAIKGDPNIETKKVMSSIVGADEADMEKQAIALVVAVLKGDLRTMVASIRKPGVQVRGLINKARFLIQYLLDDYAGVAKFVPYSARKFAEASTAASVRPNPNKLVQLQQTLLEAEFRMNTVSIDESILLQAALGPLVNANRPSKE